MATYTTNDIYVSSSVFNLPPAFPGHPVAMYTTNETYVFGRQQYKNSDVGDCVNMDRSNNGCHQDFPSGTLHLLSRVQTCCRCFILSCQSSCAVELSDTKRTMPFELRATKTQCWEDVPHLHSGSHAHRLAHLLGIQNLHNLGQALLSV